MYYVSKIYLLFKEAFWYIFLFGSNVNMFMLRVEI